MGSNGKPSEVRKNLMILSHQWSRKDEEIIERKAKWHMHSILP
jgi:hypothetical protein